MVPVFPTPSLCILFCPRVHPRQSLSYPRLTFLPRVHTRQSLTPPPCIVASSNRSRTFALQLWPHLFPRRSIPHPCPAVEPCAHPHRLLTHLKAFWQSIHCPGQCLLSNLRPYLFSAAALFAPRSGMYFDRALLPLIGSKDVTTTPPPAEHHHRSPCRSPVCLR